MAQGTDLGNAGPGRRQGATPGFPAMRRLPRPATIEAMIFVLGYLALILGLPTVIATLLTEWLRRRDRAAARLRSV